MKKLLFLAFLLLTLQKFVVLQNRLDTCNGKIIGGSILKTNICFPTYSGEFLKITPKEDGYTEDLGCTRDCTSCRASRNIKYECKKEGNIAKESFFGTPRVEPSGFYYEVYLDGRTCKENLPILATQFIPEKTCVGRISQEWSDQRNGVLVKGYTQNDCKGEERVTFYPANECVDIPGAPGSKMKFRKNL